MHLVNRLLWGIAWWAIALAKASNASVIYTYTSDQTTYTANINSHITVNLYLQETLSNSSMSILGANGGLLNAGVSVMRESVVPTSPAGLYSFSFNTADFGGPTSTDQSLTATGVQFDEEITKGSPSGVGLDNTGNGAATGYSNRVFLGNVNILTGSIGNQTTSFDVFLDNVGGVGGYTQTQQHLYDLDISSTSPAYTGAEDAGFTTFMVTTMSTPEPCSLAFVAVAAASMLLRRRRTP